MGVVSGPERVALSEGDREHLTELWLTERDQRLVAEAIEALAAEAEAFPDDEHDSGGQLADWLRRRMPTAQSPSPAGYPAPTMDPSERANGGTAVASRTGTGPAGEALTDVEAERDKLRDWLREVTEAEWSEPCRLDHHGGCQSHGYLDGPCPIPAIAEHLSAHPGASS